MSRLGGAIAESIIQQYGRSMFLSKLSDPFWFQALGCVLGMDWHSSGITTSVIGALKGAVNRRSAELGIYICGGRGKHSLQTPAELMRIADATGLNGNDLVRSSRLTAKVDNTAIQDGYQLYLHAFVLSADGEWAVVQQGMNAEAKMARRYHWHSPAVCSFTEEPHTFIYGKKQGPVLDLTNRGAAAARLGILQICREAPDRMIREIRQLNMPSHHDVRAKDVQLKRLGAVLALAHEQQVHQLDSLLLLPGLGPRTLQSLALVSEVIHGTPSRFDDPARFSFAHGGKDGHPFPVPVKVYDASIQVLENAVQQARLGNSEKTAALKNLSVAAARLEEDFVASDRLEEVIAEERQHSWKYGGRTVAGPAKKTVASATQLRLF